MTKLYPENNFKLLEQILRTIENNNNQIDIYSLLENNLELLDETVAESLYQWAIDHLSNLEYSLACQKARIIVRFCKFLQQFRVGNRKNNLEIAIQGYLSVGLILTDDSFPYEWANIQYNLGVCYSNRIEGKRANNLEQAIDYYHEALKVYTFGTYPKQWAMIHNNLGLVYPRRIKGNKLENCQKAIKYYHQALKVYTYENFPYQWANTQNNLGSLFNNRGINGNKSDNLEQAIKYFNEALKVYTYESYREKWSGIQHNLAISYRKRIKGENADNLEQALFYSQQALQFYTSQNFPETWAKIQNNLANIYCQRVEGQKKNNLEEAINCCKNALEVYTYEVYPQRWAKVNDNLAKTYLKRIKGEKINNLEQSIYHFNQVLRVYTCEDFPSSYKCTLNNLAIAYGQRILGLKSTNLEQAITYYKENLQFYTQIDDPELIAMTLNNLACSYYKKKSGEKAKNLEEAITYYHKSLQIYKQIDLPERVAMSQNNLGSVYHKRIYGEKSDNLQQAISYFERSLLFYTRNNYPYKWARTQHNLGIVYSSKIQENNTSCLEQSISHFKNALAVRTPKNLPQECIETARQLGDILFLVKNWQEAVQAYNLAIEGAEISRSWGLTPQSKQEVMEAAIGVYHRIVRTYLNMKNISTAFEYVERSKTRNLVELLASADLQPKGNFSELTLTKLNQLRNKIRTEQISIANQQRKYNTLSESSLSVPTPLPNRTNINQLQKKLDDFIVNKINPIDPNFIFTQSVKNITLREIQSLLDRQTIMLEWYIEGDRILTFIITSNSLDIWKSSKEDFQQLLEWKDNYLQTYKDKTDCWIKTLHSRLNHLSNILHIDEIVDLIPSPCQKLILIPHYFLHIFPLHALPCNNGKFLYESFSAGVRYVPSSQILKLVKQKKLKRKKEFNSLFAIADPTRKEGKSLLGSKLEVAKISQYFDSKSSIILTESQASETTLSSNKEKLESSDCLHFSCHGEFNSQSPLDSALLLADPEGKGESANLTLAKIFEKLDLKKCRLVTLSACESGIIDPTVISDEYIGIPSGFLFAGSLCVVSTLWKVDPLATTLFMIKFYQYLKRSSELDEGDIAIASIKAQNWLRTLTSKKLVRMKNSKRSQQVLKEFFQHQNQKKNYMKFKDLLEAAIKRQPYPFANPYYWTAFIPTGV